MKPIHIAIAGNLGSGKSTLARRLAKGLALEFLPRNPVDNSYVKDIFTDPARWCFEVQASLLIRKSLSISAALSAGENIVVDRSIYEDAQVFAKLFHRRGSMDARTYSTYTQLVTLALHIVDRPTLLIFCDCPHAICESRIRARGLRDFERHYPPGHIKDLEELYSEWLSTFDRCPVLTLDTSAWDLREERTATGIAEEVRRVLRLGLESEGYRQLSLFGGGQESFRSLDLEYLSLLKRHEGFSPVTIARSAAGVRLPDSPYAYIAAPFTGMLQVQTRANSLFPSSTGRREIRPGPFRQMLLDMEQALLEYGMQAVVPHRDDSRWGKRKLDLGQLVEWCSSQVQHASLMVVVPANSSGVHFELGLARAWQKPCIIFENFDGSDSVISKGVRDAWSVLRLNYRDLNDIPRILRSDQCKAFLESLAIV